MRARIRKNKLKKGYSYTVFMDYGFVNGERKRISLNRFDNKNDAENYRSKIQTEINNNTFIHIPDITFSQAIDEWMENYVANYCEPNTAAGYEIINNKYLKPCLGHIPLNIISSPEGIDIINDYYKYLRFGLENKKTLSYSTIEHHKAQISGIFTYFMRNKKLSMNICLNTVIPKTDNEKKKDIVINDVDNYNDEDLYDDDEFITPEQAVEVLNLFINTTMMVPVFFAALMGLRRSEIAGILKSKIDVEKQQLIVKNVRVRCGGKTIFKKKTKSKKSTRIIYIPRLMIDVLDLDEKRQKNNKNLYGENYIDSKFLCVADNGAPISVDAMSREFKKIFDQYYHKQKEQNPNFKLPYITLHKLRHLNISTLLSNGAYLTDVQANAGHSDINTTLHYNHNYNVGKKSIADKTDEIYTPLFKKKMG